MVHISGLRTAPHEAADTGATDHIDYMSGASIRFTERGPESTASVIEKIETGNWNIAPSWEFGAKGSDVRRSPISRTSPFPSLSCYRGLPVAVPGTLLQGIRTCGPIPLIGLNRFIVE